MLLEQELPPATVASGNRALAEFQRRHKEAEARIVSRQTEIEDLQQGLDLGRTDLGGNGVPNYVPLTPVSDDTRFFQLSQQDPLLTAYFGGGAKPPVAVNEITAGVGEGNTAHPATPTPGRGILSGLTRFSWLRWLDSRAGVFGLTSVSMVVGLLCLFILVGALSRPTPTTVVETAQATATPASVVLDGGLSAPVTAQSQQMTALAVKPTTAPDTRPPLTPLPTATQDYSQDPHAGLLPPAKLAAPALSLSNDKIRRFQSSADGQSLVSVPPKGVIYHFGAYPGERPGNVVLVGDYETIGTWLELLQVNDLVQVIDRNGGIYTYKILPWDLVTAQAEQTTVQTVAPTTMTGLGQSYQAATAVAGIPYQVEKLTTWQDVSLAAKPTNPTLSILTLVALVNNSGNRYAVRARFVSYSPASNLPPGTPVPLSPTPGATPAPTAMP